MITEKKRRRTQALRRKTPQLVHRFEREMTRLGRQQFEYLAGIYRAKLLPALAPSMVGFFDADEDELQRLRNILDTITGDGQKQFSRDELERRVRGILNQLDSSVRSQLSTTFGNEAAGMVYNREIEAIINRTVSRSALDYRASSDRTAKLIGDRISSGLIAGERHQSIGRALTGILSNDGDEKKSAVNRAKFIARNTVSRSLGEINKTRQLNSNIELYTWQTAEDERVRPTHADLNGQVFAWQGKVTIKGKTYEMARDPDFNNGAPTIPGMPWSCRCVGLAYIPELEEID